MEAVKAQKDVSDKPKPASEVKEVDKVVEEPDEVEDAETVEELDEIEEADAVEELGEIEEAEAVEELDEAEEAEPVEELDEVEDAEALEELSEVEDAEAVEELSEIEDMDDPMLRLNDLGYTISGLDFSELDVPISELEKTEAKKVEYITEDYSPIRSMWGKYDESPILGTLDVVGESEPVPLLDINEEQTIVNEDGVFIIRKTEPIKPENKDFKALVDSVLR